MKLGDQTASTSNVRRVDFGDCGPPQPPKSIHSSNEDRRRFSRGQVGTSRPDLWITAPQVSYACPVAT